MSWRQVMWQGAARYTFFSLPQTILSDFDEHIWRALVESTRLFVPYMPKLFYISSGKDFPLEIDFKNPIGESGEEEFSEFDNEYKLSQEELYLIKIWVRDEDLHHLESHPAPVIDVHQTYMGKTIIVYWVRSSTAEYRVNFRLQAAQYRRDKLQLCLIDYTDLSPSDYFKTWLNWGWGKEASTPLPLENAPAQLQKNELTEAEKYVANRLAEGLDDEAISVERVSSPRTVETQRKSLARKLGILADKNTIAKSLRELGFPSV